MTPRRTRIDCRDAFDRLYAYLDGELTPEQASEVREHLEGCQNCLAIAEFETAYIRFLQARTRAQCAPAELKKRILRDLLFTKDPETE